MFCGTTRPATVRTLATSDGFLAVVSRDSLEAGTSWRLTADRPVPLAARSYGHHSHGERSASRGIGKPTVDVGRARLGWQLSGGRGGPLRPLLKTKTEGAVAMVSSLALLPERAGGRRPGRPGRSSPAIAAGEGAPRQCACGHRPQQAWRHRSTRSSRSALEIYYRLRLSRRGTIETRHPPGIGLMSMSFRDPKRSAGSNGRSSSGVGNFRSSRRRGVGGTGGGGFSAWLGIRLRTAVRSTSPGGTSAPQVAHVLPPRFTPSHTRQRQTLTRESGR